MIGASWSGQLTAFLISFGFGVLGGIPAILFLRKSRPFERALTDFTAIALMTLLYLASTELGNDGKFAAFTLVAFVLGALIMPSLFTKIKSKRLIAEQDAKNNAANDKTDADKNGAFLRAKAAFARLKKDERK